MLSFTREAHLFEVRRDIYLPPGQPLKTMEHYCGNMVLHAVSAELEKLQNDPEMSEGLEIVTLENMTLEPDHVTMISTDEIYRALTFAVGRRTEEKQAAIRPKSIRSLRKSVEEKTKKLGNQQRDITPELLYGTLLEFESDGVVLGIALKQKNPPSIPRKSRKPADPESERIRLIDRAADPSSDTISRERAIYCNAIRNHTAHRDHEGEITDSRGLLHKYRPTIRLLRLPYNIAWLGIDGVVREATDPELRIVPNVSTILLKKASEVLFAAKQAGRAKNGAMASFRVEPARLEVTEIPKPRTSD